jgi:hypothetical protein
MQTGRSKLYVQRKPATDLGLVHGTGRTHIDTEAGADMEEDSLVPGGEQEEQEGEEENSQLSGEENKEETSGEETGEEATITTRPTTHNKSTGTKGGFKHRAIA